MATFSATSDNPDGPNQAGIMQTSEEPQHVWYYDADDDFPMADPTNPQPPTEAGESLFTAIN
jgi:hypothetical protein